MRNLKTDKLDYSKMLQSINEALQERVRMATRGLLEEMNKSRVSTLILIVDS